MSDRTAQLLLLLTVGAFLATRSTPRGIRNNNPGNLLDVGIPWRGLIGRDVDGYAIFGTALEGIRAMYIDLRTGFQRDAEDTVAEIVTEWAPPPTNPTAQYIAFVSARLGVTPTTRLELERDAPALIDALITFENGRNPYPASLIDSAIRAA